MQSTRASAPLDPLSDETVRRSGPRWLLWGGAIVVLIVIGVGSYLYLQRSRPVRANYTTVPAVKGSILGTVNSTGQIAPWNQAKLAFGTPGIIATVAVKVGDRVNQGDTLASLDPTDQTISVRQQDAILAAAKARLESIKAGPRPEDVAIAQATLDAAQAKLDGMIAQGRPEDVQSAQAVLDAARAKLNGMLAQGRPEDVQAAQDALNSAKARLHQIKQGPQAADVAVATTAIQAAQTQLTQRQSDLARLTRPADPTAIQQAQSAVAQAKSFVWQQQLTRDGACGDKTVPAYRCQAAQSAVAQAESAQQQAQSKLDQLSVPSHAEDIAAATAAVTSAEAGLASSQAKLNQLNAGALPDDISQAAAAVSEAQQALATRQIPWRPADIAQQRDVVAQAAAQLDLKKKPFSQTDTDQQRQAVAQAEAQLSLKKQPYTPTDVAQAQAAVDQALAQLDQVKHSLDLTILKAPFSGIVSAVNANIGEIFSPTGGTPVVGLVDPTNLRLDANIDETDISHVQIGQDVNIAFDALLGKTFTGKVLSLAPNATVQSGVATYTVSISVENGADIKPGMTGNADIVYAHHNDALLVPNRAVHTEGDHRVVLVLEGGQSRSKTVTVGISDDKSTEIDSGLQVGDQIVLPSTSTVAPALTTGGIRR